MHSIDLESLQNDAVVDALWHIGLHSHSMSQEERVAYVCYLKNNKVALGSKSILNGIGYLLHSYFYNMTDDEKVQYINLLLETKLEPLPLIGEIFDIICIIYKTAPPPQKNGLLQYVLDKSYICISEPTAIISVCNCFEYMFDELLTEEKGILVNKLRYLRAENPFDFLDDSILFTLNKLEGGKNK